MSVFTDILSAPFAKIVETVGTVLDSLFTSQDEKDKNKIALLQVQLAALAAKDQVTIELERIDAEREAKIIADMANLRDQIKQELASQDWFVRRARPLPIWIGSLILTFNLLLFPLITLVHNLFAKEPVTIASLPMPPEFWYVYTGLTLGYGALRSWDKSRAAKNGMSATP